MRLSSVLSGRRKYLAALLLVGVIGGAWFVSRPEPLKVAVATVERGTVEASVSNTRAGTVKACRRAKLAPPAGGQIAAMKVKKGQRVKAGEVLLELWNTDLQAQRGLAAEQLLAAKTQASDSCALADTAHRDVERARDLAKQGFYSPQSLDRSEAEARSRVAACEVARNGLKQAQSRIALSDATLERMVLRAPFDGIVADLSGELGEYATPSPPGIPTLPAVDLIDDSCLYVSAPIDEVDAGHLKVGQIGRITLDALKGKSYEGRVRRIAPYVTEIEKQARTVEVEVEFTPPPATDTLLVGYSADVELVHQSHPNVLRIPTQALQDGKRVLLLRADGVLEDRIVTVGLGNWSHTEISAGLQAGDRIVTSFDGEGVKAGARAQAETALPAK
ncbi:Macrolide export protein MacA [Ferriphaselus amnicola]|uniref:Macrolide export protein MacA n=1 Tax=Ferriphaselus amnicola TaxID=1188319 RepID=A0A2Z6G8R6_9PROT|nr:efflux RND transporter periplasmic adaptor subunit [Ferriphaselus amnicola]BBE49866.1 Macrolide export protein MacA [Ferriphaselus amnicola]